MTVYVPIPAVCDTCGRVLRGISVRAGEPNVAHLEGNVIACPCGGTGSVPDGTFSATTDGILQAVGLTDEGRETLRRAGVLIRELLDQDVAPQEIVERVRQQVSPAVADRLTPTRAQLRRVSLWAVGAYTAGFLAAAGTDTYEHAKSQLAPKTVEQQEPAAVHLPAGSEGTIAYPDGMIVRWAPGTRPTRRHRPGPQP